MSETLGRSAVDALTQPASAATVSAATVGTGAGTVFEIIPYITGSVASILGSVLSFVVIIISVKNYRTKKKKDALESELLRLEIEEKKNGSNQRQKT